MLAHRAEGYFHFDLPFRPGRMVALKKFCVSAQGGKPLLTGVVEICLISC